MSRRKAKPELAYRRARLQEWELPSWRPLRFHFEAGGDAEIWSGDRLIAQFNTEELKRQLSPEHARLFTTLLENLLVQAGTAAHAVPVAKLELTVAAGRGSGGRKTAEPRKADAAEREADLKAAAEKMRAVDPGLSISDLADKLSERGHGGASAIRKKLSSLLKKR